MSTMPPSRPPGGGPGTTFEGSEDLSDAIPGPEPEVPSLDEPDSAILREP